MNHAKAQQRARQRIMAGQAAIILLHGLIFALAAGVTAAAAALFGSLIVILNNLMQVWQLKRADRIAGREAGRNLRYLYRCTIERYLVTVAMLAAGVGALELAVLPLISGFIIGHVAMVGRWFLESSARRKHGY